MSNAAIQKQNAAEVRPDDPRLIRAADKVIRLYDLQPNDLFAVRAESLASLISEELNRPKESLNVSQGTLVTE